MILDAARLTAGWLPAAFSLDPGSALHERAHLRLIEAPADALAEPFMRQTMDRLRSGRPRAREIDIDLDALGDLAEVLPPARPAGLIFHMSRCGSTLLSNVLKTVPELLVLSEPQAPSQLLSPAFWGPPMGPLSPYAADLWEHTRNDLLRCLVRLYAAFRGGAPARPVIKFQSLDTLRMALLRRLWPDTPAVVLVRDPVEVVVAHLGGSLWGDLQQDRARSLEVLGWEGADMDTLEFSARALGQRQEAALAALDHGCEVIDYSQLTLDRIARITRRFGATLKEGPALDQALALYSKDPGRVMIHRDDTQDKQVRASPQLRSAAVTWAGVGYQRLKTIASQQSV